VNYARNHNQENPGADTPGATSSRGNGRAIDAEDHFGTDNQILTREEGKV